MGVSGGPGLLADGWGYWGQACCGRHTRGGLAAGWAHHTRCRLPPPCGNGDGQRERVSWRGLGRPCRLQDGGHGAH